MTLLSLTLYTVKQLQLPSYVNTGDSILYSSHKDAFSSPTQTFSLLASFNRTGRTNNVNNYLKDKTQLSPLLWSHDISSDWFIFSYALLISSVVCVSLLDIWHYTDHLQVIIVRGIITALCIICRRHTGLGLTLHSTHNSQYLCALEQTTSHTAPSNKSWNCDCC